MALDFLQQLNPEQQNAVTHTDGPSMVIAGAGSGKTRVLTYRIAYLLSKGILPFNILALTFTNKAARDMIERIEKTTGNNARSIWMNTFHSIFAKILRVEAHYIDFKPHFTIYDTDDSKSLIRNIIKEMNLDDKIYTPGLVYNRISNAKNKLISHHEYQNNSELLEEDIKFRRPLLGNIYIEYQNRCKKADAMDFDDLLFQTWNLFSKNFDVLEKYQKKFKYIMVDEYQDTNYAQYAIIKLLAKRYMNICVVGDDSQSIYGFRGADITNILNFVKDYPDSKIFKLEQNYRSTKTIVDVSNAIIANNQNRLKKEVWTENESGDKIQLIRALSDNEEGRQVADSIFEIKMNRKALNSEFAILYRTNAQSRAFEEALRRLNIKYRVYGGMSFYQRKEIKDLLAYLRIVANPADEQALRRIINYPKRGIGDSTVERLHAFANDNNISLWQAIEYNTVNLKEIKLPKSLKDFEELIKSYRSMLQTKNAYEMAMHISKTAGIIDELHSDKSFIGVARFENIQSLLNGISEFVANPENENNSLEMFLQMVTLYTDADDEKVDKDTVSVMTMHSAKGLEFPYVYVTGMEEQLFPSSMSSNTQHDLEEERRLFYVAVTRAKKKLTLSYANSRYKWGKLSHCQPSRFLDEIEPENFVQQKYFFGNMDMTDRILRSEKTTSLTRLMNPLNPKIPKSQNSQIPYIPSPDFKSSEASLITQGMRVEHPRFGMGTIAKITSQNSERKALVNFDISGEKILLLSYAKLMIKVEL